MNEGLNVPQVTTSPIIVAAAWGGAMLLVFGTSSRLSFLLADLWCTKEVRIAIENFFSRPIPSMSVLATFGVLVLIYTVAQLALYGSNFFACLIRSVALVPAIVLMLLVLQLITGTCGVESQFLSRYGTEIIIVICLAASAVLTIFACYLVARKVVLPVRVGRLMASAFLLANAGALLSLIQLSAVVFVRGWQ